MTCNPRWPEIQREMRQKGLSKPPPELCARVFKMKLDELTKDLYEKGVFGQHVAHVHVIEFQKRGLPHAHILLILKSCDSPKDASMYDRFVSAEIPDPTKSPEHARLHYLVLRHMVHVHKPPCQTDDCKCKRGFPKKYQSATTDSADSFPQYRRRAPDPDAAARGDFDRTAVYKGRIITNAYIVPYNPWLLYKYQCHLNVEICTSIKSVKYLFKYVYKGHDRVMYRVGASAVHMHVCIRMFTHVHTIVNSYMCLRNRIESERSS